ncbi:MAG: hypothetical protein ACRC20_05405 [Segniliparus sp.]|uniref:hypothetical protein n=1 Tax=Segniliparus sp. TaxID=2804064 RepID=UPI003F350FFA
MITLLGPTLTALVSGAVSIYTNSVSARDQRDKIKQDIEMLNILDRSSQSHSILSTYVDDRIEKLSDEALHMGKKQGSITVVFWTIGLIAIVGAVLALRPSAIDSSALKILLLILSVALILEIQRRKRSFNRLIKKAEQDRQQRKQRHRHANAFWGKFSIPDPAPPTGETGAE